MQSLLSQQLENFISMFSFSFQVGHFLDRLFAQIFEQYL